jgi:hypothetical protein
MTKKYIIELFHSDKYQRYVAIWKDGKDIISTFGDSPEEALHEFADDLYLFRNCNLKNGDKITNGYKEEQNR